MEPSEDTLTVWWKEEAEAHEGEGAGRRQGAKAGGDPCSPHWVVAEGARPWPKSIRKYLLPEPDIRMSHNYNQTSQRSWDMQGEI